MQAQNEPKPEKQGLFSLVARPGADSLSKVLNYPEPQQYGAVNQQKLMRMDASSSSARHQNFIPLRDSSATIPTIKDNRVSKPPPVLGIAQESKLSVKSVQYAESSLRSPSESRLSTGILGKALIASSVPNSAQTGVPVDAIPQPLEPLPLQPGGESTTQASVQQPVPKAQPNAQQRNSAGSIPGVAHQLSGVHSNDLLRVTRPAQNTQVSGASTPALSVTTGQLTGPSTPLADGDCQFFCGCGRLYKSFAALFTHCRLKHDSKFIGMTLIRKRNEFYTIQEGSDINCSSRSDFQLLPPELARKVSSMVGRPITSAQSTQVVSGAAGSRPNPAANGQRPTEGAKHDANPPEGFISNLSFAPKMRGFAIFLESLGARSVDEPFGKKNGFEKALVAQHQEEDQDAQFVLTNKDLSTCKLGARIHFGPGSPEEMFNHFPLEWFPDAKLVQPIWDGLKNLQNFMIEDYGDVFTSEVDLVTRDYEMTITSTLCLFLVFVFPQVSSQFYKELVVLVIALRQIFNQSLQETAQSNEDYFADSMDPEALPQIFDKFLHKGGYKAFLLDKKSFNKASALEHLKPSAGSYNRVVTVCKYMSEWLYHFHLSDQVAAYMPTMNPGMNQIPHHGSYFSQMRNQIKPATNVPIYQQLGASKHPQNQMRPGQKP